MEFKDGTNVYTFDGKMVGNLRRVVIDPETKDVTHIVIQKGVFYKEDKVIEVEKVDSAAPERITLNCIADDLKEMTPLDVKKYIFMEGAPPQEQNYGANWSSGTGRSLVAIKQRTISEGLVALKEGARVVSEEGSHVGNIERVYTNSETGRVNYFTIAQGLLNRTRKSVPVGWVKYLDDDEVRLSVDARRVEEFPADKV